MIGERERERERKRYILGHGSSQIRVLYEREDVLHAHVDITRRV